MLSVTAIIFSVWQTDYSVFISNGTWKEYDVKFVRAPAFSWSQLSIARGGLVVNFHSLCWLSGIRADDAVLYGSYWDAFTVCFMWIWWCHLKEIPDTLEQFWVHCVYAFCKFFTCFSLCGPSNSLFSDSNWPQWQPKPSSPILNL